MMSVKEKMRFNFIPNELYDRLDDSVRERLLRYRERYRLLAMKEKRVNTLKHKLEEQKNLLNEMKRDLKDSLPSIAHLKSDYYFNCSVVSFKNKNIIYYNLCISRYQSAPKNCSLGNEDTIKNHLLKYYEDDKKVIAEIRTDWKGWLKVESNIGDTYTKIMAMIMDNPLGFKNLTINRNTLFPI
jgi:hypothetical protein